MREDSPTSPQYGNKSSRDDPWHRSLSPQLAPEVIKSPSGSVDTPQRVEVGPQNCRERNWPQLDDAMRERIGLAEIDIKVTRYSRFLSCFRGSATVGVVVRRDALRLRCHVGDIRPGTLREMGRETSRFELLDRDHGIASAEVNRPCVRADNDRADAAVRMRTLRVWTDPARASLPVQNAGSLLCL